MTKAEGTRMMILQTALKLIYRQGYQATSIDEIIAGTSVTKGALFSIISRTKRKWGWPL